MPILLNNLYDGTSMRDLKKITTQVFFPLLTGAFLYKYGSWMGALIFYLPDGLWAYALASSLHLIWGREMNHLWIMLMFCIFVFFELLQYQHVIPGTGDILDIIIYFVFAGFSFFFNTRFHLKFINNAIYL